MGRYGVCRRLRGGKDFEIEISKFILNDIDTLTNTIYHEVLHTVEGCLNHGSKWKKLADKTNKIYNVNITTKTSANETIKTEYLKKAKYKIICNNCKEVMYRQRMSQLIRYPENYKCGLCDGKLKVVEM